jgi:hypothetical protein
MWKNNTQIPLVKMKIGTIILGNSSALPSEVKHTLFYDLPISLLAIKPGASVLKLFGFRTSFICEK